MNGATPVFVEPDQYDNLDAEKIEEKITPNTKAILAVHLYGQSCDMTRIMEIAKKYNLKVVEDCAQSHGNHWHGQTVGTFGDIGCFSFYPSKGCGAFGDAGAIVTNNPDIADKFRVFRNYGSRVRYQNEVVGTNSRLDELQAGLLRVKLQYLDGFNAERCKIAQRYNENLPTDLIELPRIRPGADCSWHQYVIHVKDGKRDHLMEYLKDKGIGTIIHYPIPPHCQQAFQFEYGSLSLPLTERLHREELSLPIFPQLTDEEVQRVIDAVNSFGAC